jgi:transcriptional regulator with XRE-family HTH domain
MSVNGDDFKQALGRRVQELRGLKNFGVREFALIADIEHHQLINIEKGRVDIRLSTLRKIAKALEIEPKELLEFN